jgi:hypothetical protein
MPELAIGGAAVGGIGGGAFVLLVTLTYLLRFALQFSRRGQRYTSMRRPGQGRPGQGPGGIAQPGPDAPLPAPSPEDVKRREQAHAYWEAEQPPEGTLPAEGYIGDDGGPAPDGGRDQEPAGQ